MYGINITLKIKGECENLRQFRDLTETIEKSICHAEDMGCTTEFVAEISGADYSTNMNTPTNTTRIEGVYEAGQQQVLDDIGEILADKSGDDLLAAIKQYIADNGTTITE